MSGNIDPIIIFIGMNGSVKGRAIRCQWRTWERSSAWEQDRVQRGLSVRELDTGLDCGCGMRKFVSRLFLALLGPATARQNTGGSLCARCTEGLRGPDFLWRFVRMHFNLPYCELTSEPPEQGAPAQAAAHAVSSRERNFHFPLS